MNQNPYQSPAEIEGSPHVSGGTPFLISQRASGAYVLLSFAACALVGHWIPLTMVFLIAIAEFIRGWNLSEQGRHGEQGSHADTQKKAP